MRKFSLLITILALAFGVFALAGCGSDDDGDATGGEVTVELSEVDGSGQTGTATLTSDGEMTNVSIEIDAIRCPIPSRRTSTRATAAKS